MEMFVYEPLLGRSYNKISGSYNSEDQDYSFLESDTM
jgi:hypothetical protein